MQGRCRRSSASSDREPRASGAQDAFCGPGVLPKRALGAAPRSVVSCPGSSVARPGESLVVAALVAARIRETCRFLLDTKPTMLPSCQRAVFNWSNWPVEHFRRSTSALCRAPSESLHNGANEHRSVTARSSRRVNSRRTTRVNVVFELTTFFRFATLRGGGWHQGSRGFSKDAILKGGVIP